MCAITSRISNNYKPKLITMNRSLIKCALLTSLIVSSGAITTAVEAATYPESSRIKSIPLPPLGQRWVVNEQYSDEFNGTELDDTKWNDLYPGWIGREPGLFETKNIEFEDGYMVLHGEKMDKEVVVDGRTFNISCAAVTSKEKTAHFGYYECRFKANLTTLSSTFWFSTRAKFDTKGRQPEDGLHGIFWQELDVCECVGRSSNSGGTKFADGMHANVHYWVTPEGGPQGMDTRARETRLLREDGAKLSEDFNTFGVWWSDESTATFYLNDGEGYGPEFVARKSNDEPYDIPFTFPEPMGMNFVVETYPQPWMEIPNDEELADPTKNRTYYDWVRSYVLVDVEDPNSGAAPMVMFEDKVNIADNIPSISGDLAVKVRYTAGVDRKIVVVVYDKSGAELAREMVAAPAGYANLAVSAKSFNKALSSGNSYDIVAYMIDADASGFDSGYLDGDSYELAIQ